MNWAVGGCKLMVIFIFRPPLATRSLQLFLVHLVKIFFIKSEEKSKKNWKRKSGE